MAGWYREDPPRPPRDSQRPSQAEPPEPFSTSRLWKKRPSVPAQVRRARPTQTREGMGGGGAGGRHTPIAGGKHAYIAHYLRIAIAHKIDKRKQVKPFCRFDLLFCLERVTGIEPASSAWKAEVLPLNHTRVRGRGDWIRTSDPLLPKQMRYQAAPRPGRK